MTAINVTGAGYQRRELGGCLPLATPFALHIFPSHRCNLKCHYCLHSLPGETLAKSGFQKVSMDFDLFKKCIDDATGFAERLKVVILAGWGEPLTHPRIAEMVDYVKRRDVAERVEIVTNGILLTNELAVRLVEAGLDRIRISIQGIDSERCSQLAGVKVDFDALVDNIRFIHAHKGQCRVYVKTVDAAVPAEQDRRRYHEIFADICDEIAIEQIIPAIREIDHAGIGTKLDTRHCGGRATYVKVCPFPFYMCVIYPDGRYAPCCSSELPANFGNVREASLVALWNASHLQAFRVAHLQGQRGHSAVCHACPRPQYDIQQGDNLDPYAEKLLATYSEKVVKGKSCER